MSNRVSILPISNYSAKTELKPFWTKIFNFDWKFGLFLILVICLPRFVLVLHANQTSNYAYIGIVMLLSALAPFLFLSKEGKRKIGLGKPKNNTWLFYALIIGIVFSLFLYFLGEFMYCDSYRNWYQYIANSYNIPAEIGQNDKLFLFAAMAFIGITFSPIGEELFFRGIVHSSFAKSIGNRKASIVDSAAFAIVHVSHFGLVFIHQQWTFLFFPTLIWVSSMFVLSRLFYICRKNSNSILGAIICHSFFNLGMIYCIFYPFIQHS